MATERRHRATEKDKKKPSTLSTQTPNSGALMETVDG